MPKCTLVVKGKFVTFDEGDRTKGLTIGLGTGTSHLRTRTSTRDELLPQQITTEAILLIQAELPPRTLGRQLKTFLTPALRSRERLSYRKLLDHFVEPGSALGATKRKESRSMADSIADATSTAARYLGD